MPADLLRLTRDILRGGWAPLAVLLASFPIANLRYAESAYSVLHLLGGVALAWFFRRSVRIVYRGWPPVLSSLVAFALACTGALAWEVAEFAIDFVFGTTLQKGLLDTMTDLILAAGGAAAWLALRRCPMPRVQPQARPGHRTRDTVRQPGGESAENRTAPARARA